MKKDVILVLLDQFSDWEGSYLAAALNAGVGFEPQETQYTAKTLSLDGKAVRSIGGQVVTPDYSLATMPNDFAALILIGGFGWLDDKAKMLIPFVKHAIDNNIIVGGICNGSLFLGIHGFLNNVKHTSNLVDYLKQYGGEQYQGEQHYLAQQSVCDHNIVTANGCATLEFTRDLLLLLQVDTAENIEQYYRLHKFGFYA